MEIFQIFTVYTYHWRTSKFYDKQLNFQTIVLER